MYIVIGNNKFIGFSLKEEDGYKNIEISEVEHQNFIEKQSEGYTLCWNKKQLEAIKLNDFEYIDENGKVIKDIATELKHYRDLLLTFRKEKVQLKKDIRDFEEFEEDTAELEDQLKEKEKQIAEMENKIKELEG